jgi:pimeloyl-ACP methyl ester carboxylesterase
MARPEKVTAIVSQNGNAYEEGLGDAWAPIRRYWEQPTPANREFLRQVLNASGIRSQYTDGVSHPEEIDPVGYTLDTALIERPGNMDIQLDLFLDYANNVKLYPKFQQYFSPPGAEAYPRDNPNAQVQLLDTGHFALETHLSEIVAAMRNFLESAIKEKA